MLIFITIYLLSYSSQFINQNLEYMKSMRSNINEPIQNFKIGFDKLELFLKRHWLKLINNYLPNFNSKLYKYTGKENGRSTQWLLQADRFAADDKKNPLRQDDQIKVKSYHMMSKPKQTIKRVPQRFSIRRESSSLHHKNSLTRKSTPILGATMMPLDSLSESGSIQEQDDTINRFRQQKTRREQYKNKILQAERNQVFKLISQALTNIIINPSKKPKRQKLHQIDHFINMDVSVRQPEETHPQHCVKTVKSLYKNKNSKTQRPTKGNNTPFYLCKEKEHLKPQDKVYLLNTPNKMKLNNGVTYRDNQKYNHNYERVPITNFNRKKLQFLKNEQIDAVKIKMSELMSYKKITTMTNLAYCSSMKTVKQLPKDAIQSKISIDSKQFVEQANGSKKLIKIANRRIYEQLLIDFNDEGEVNLKKTRFKPKKQNKVRFQSRQA